MTVQPLYDEEPGRSAASSGMGGVALSNDIVIPYFTDLTNTEQKQRRLPGIAAGEQITAIAMTEPGTGSDLSRIRARAPGPATTTSSTARRPSSPTGRTPTSSQRRSARATTRAAASRSSSSRGGWRGVERPARGEGSHRHPHRLLPELSLRRGGRDGEVVGHRAPEPHRRPGPRPLTAPPPTHDPTKAGHG